MNIAKIVSSNSHIDYVARVIDELDAAEVPTPDDYGFGQFVKIEAAGDEMIGVIYDSRLINPEYASFGPRLSPKPSLGAFSPDFLNEQGVLLGILLLGTSASPGQGIPRRVIPPGQDVEKMDGPEVRSFHKDSDGKMRLHYFSQVMTHAGSFAIPLLEAIVDEIGTGAGEIDAAMLNVLRQSLKWQKTFGGAKF